MFELAATKTLMVVKYDKWKVIEDYLTPEKEFLYYYSLEDLTKNKGYSYYRGKLLDYN